LLIAQRKEVFFHANEIQILIVQRSNHIEAPILYNQFPKFFHEGPIQFGDKVNVYFRIKTFGTVFGDDLEIGAGWFDKVYGWYVGDWFTFSGGGEEEVECDA